MKLEGGKVSVAQIMLLILGYTWSLALLFIPAPSAKHLVWLAILIAIILGTGFVFISTTLALRFPGKSLIQINKIVFGPYLGLIISLGYLWFFLHVASLNLRVYGDFFTTTIYPETPLIVILLLTMAACAMAAKNGIEVIARCSQVLVIIALFSFFFDTALLLKEVNPANLLPLSGVPLKDILKAGFTVNSIQFGGTVVFLMFYPFLNRIKKARMAIISIILGGVILVMTEVRNRAVLGKTIDIMVYPTFEAIKIINIADVLTRLEIIVTVNFLFLGFLKISLLFYGTVLGTAQLLKLSTYRPLVLPIGAIIICLSIINVENAVADFAFATGAYPLYAFPFELGVPLLTLIIALIRGLRSKEA